MVMIENLTRYAVIFIVIILLLGIAAVAGLIVFKRKNKGLLNEEDSPEKRRYEDAMKLVQIDDIADDMIIADGGKRFIAVLKCRGGDFLRSDIDEQVRTEYAYANFWLNQNAPISYRQDGEDINLEHTIKKYDDAYRKHESELFNLEEDRKILLAEFEKVRTSDQARAEELAERIRKLNKKSDTINWRMLHIEDQVRHVRRISGNAAGRQKSNQTYVFSWSPDDGIINPYMTEEETYKKAQRELEDMCRDKMRLLSDAGAVATRCNTEALIDMCRRYFRPYSGNRFTADEIEKTSFFDDINASKAYERKSREAVMGRAEKYIFGEGGRS